MRGEHALAWSNGRMKTHAACRKSRLKSLVAILATNDDKNADLDRYRDSDMTRELRFCGASCQD
jgi:hypothetical protein